MGKLVDRRATTWVRHLQQGSTYWLTAQGRRQLQDPDGRPALVAGSESIAATSVRTIPPPPELPNGLVFEIEGVEVAVRPHFMPVMVSTQRP